MSGRLHEHSPGADRRVCQWTAKKQIWGCFHKRQQWYEIFYKYSEF